MRVLNILAARLIASTAFYDTGKTAGWKLDDAGHIVMKDGNPVWLNTAGAEQVVETGTISRLNAEAAGHRQRADAAETALKAYEGIDPVKARDAFGTLEKIDQKKLIDAGKVDEVKAEVEKSFTVKLTAAENRAAETEARYNHMVVKSAFGSSKFIGDKLTIPADIVQATFGQRFKIDENGNVVGVQADGKPIYSPTRAGELASFDEALETLINEYPNKTAIMKGANHSGSGNTGGGGAVGGKAKYTRDEFSKKTPAEQAVIAADVRADKAVLVD